MMRLGSISLILCWSVASASLPRSTFPVIAQNVYGLKVTNTLSVNLPETGQLMVLEHFSPARASFRLAFVAWRGNLPVAGR